jgi:DNA-binding CsgD family transcriptional regulator
MPLKSLLKILDTDVLFEKIKKLWIEHHQKERGYVPTAINFDSKTLEILSENSPNLYMVFDWTDLSIHYVSKNIFDKIGYTREQLSENQFRLLFKILKFEHIFFFAKVLFWDKVANVQLTQQMRHESYSFVICGLTFKHKNGHFVKTMIRSYGLEINQKGFPIYGIIEFTEINHLLKSDDYWVMVSAGKTNKKSIVFFSTELNNKGTYLLSPRELEILKLIEKGLTSKEIAAILFLSVGTVEKHRKNMLGRVGATDSNALIELCKRCDLL